MIDPASVSVTPWPTNERNDNLQSRCAEIDLITNRIPLLHVSAEYADKIDRRIQQSLQQVQSVKAYEVSITDHLQNLLSQLTGRDIPAHITESIASQLLFGGQFADGPDSILPPQNLLNRQNVGVPELKLSRLPDEQVKLSPNSPRQLAPPNCFSQDMESSDALSLQLKNQQEIEIRTKMEEHDEVLRQKLEEMENVYESRIKTMKAEFTAEMGKDSAMVHQLQSQLQETKTQIKRYELTAKDLETLLKAKGEFCSSLQTTLKESESQLVHFKNQIEKLKIANAKGDIAKEKFREDIADVKSKLERLQDLIKLTQDELTKEKRLRVIIETELNEQRDFLTQSERLIEETESRAIEAEGKLNTMSEHETKTKEYLAVLSEFRGRLVHLEAIAAEVRDQLHNNEDYRNEIENILEEDQRVLQEQDSYVSQVFNQMTAMSNYCSKQTKEVEILKDSLRRCVQHLEEKDELLKLTTSEKETANLYLPLERRKYQALETEFKEIQGQKQVLENQLQKTTEQLLQAKHTISGSAQANSQTGVLEPVVKKLQDQISLITLEKEQLKATLAGAEIKIADLQIQKANRNAEYAEDKSRSQKIWEETFAYMQKRLDDQRSQHLELISILRETVPPGTNDFIANFMEKNPDCDPVSTDYEQCIEAILTTDRRHNRSYRLSGAIQRLNAPNE